MSLADLRLCSCTWSSRSWLPCYARRIAVLLCNWKLPCPWVEPCAQDKEPSWTQGQNPSSSSALGRRPGWLSLPRLPLPLFLLLSASAIPADPTPCLSKTSISEDQYKEPLCFWSRTCSRFPLSPFPPYWQYSDLSEGSTKHFAFNFHPVIKSLF